MEKRVDPSDGQAYTKLEFFTQYGGYAEWNVARPPAGITAGAGAGAAGGLVEQIKQKQRADIAFRDLWRQWCEANADGTYDPKRMDAMMLKRAWAACNKGSVGIVPVPTATGPSVGTTATGGSKRVDPNDGQMYTKAQFYQQYGGYAEWNAAAPPSMSGGGDETWIEKVKASQRSDPAFKVAWVKWCNEHADGKKDPKCMDTPTLKKAWGQCTRIAQGGGAMGVAGGRAAGGRVAGGRGAAPARAAPYAGARGGKGAGPTGPTFQEALAMRVVNRQKTDPAFREKWVALRDSKNGKYDPRLMTAGQLRSALEEIDGYDSTAAAVYAEMAQEQIKSNESFRQKWKAYCQATTNGTFDPRRLSQTEILEGLRQCGAAGLHEAETKTMLAAQVREKQRADKEYVQRWRDYCASNSMPCDPARLTLAQLQAAMAAASG
eukprot:TRINITY_DN1061_c0_g2_i2.p1 TRINITY_DN1061_c0_g2~~TRINITY_DN1061_c0_g2_i2.p1  ORF type:complete len:434 (+),score=164.06 TRINITY_DN1061_c0_g2_i2:79-1380(+)